MPKKKPVVIPDIAPQIAVQAAVAPIRLDLGCGPNKKPGFTGVDSRSFPGVEVVHDLNVYPWPFADKSVDEINASHFVEHLDHNRHNPERVRFFNEIYRILKVGARATITTPTAASGRHYGDFTHSSDPVHEFGYYYLDRDWRKSQAPHTDIQWNKDGHNCHFPGTTWGYTLRQDLLSRNVEYQAYALANYMGAGQDLIATLVRGEDEVVVQPAA